MTFYQRLVQETTPDRNRFMGIQLIQHALAKGASREMYLDFLAEAYHHVKHTYAELALASALTQDEAYQDALIEYMEEERGHEKWILDDIKVIGGDAEAVRQGKPGIACTAMVGYVYYAIEWQGPFAMLGSVHVLEGISTMLADQAASALKSALNIGDEGGFSYLRSHGALDIEHVAFFEKFVNTIEDRAKQDQIIDTAKVIYKLYGDIFNEIGDRHLGWN